MSEPPSGLHTCTHRPALGVSPPSGHHSRCCQPALVLLFRWGCGCGTGTRCCTRTRSGSTGGRTTATPPRRAPFTVSLRRSAAEEQRSSFPFLGAWARDSHRQRVWVCACTCACRRRGRRQRVWPPAGRRAHDRVHEGGHQHLGHQRRGARASVGAGTRCRDAPAGGRNAGTGLGRTGRDEAGAARRLCVRAGHQSRMGGRRCSALAQRTWRQEGHGGRGPRTAHGKAAC